MEFDQIKELMLQLEASKLTKLVYKKKDFELHLEKESLALPAPRSRMVAAEAESAFQSEVPQKGERGGSTRVDLPGTFVTSPMVGTFYSCPAPGEPTFVKVGDKVDENTVVCIVEAMKVMNEVKAGISGTVAEVLVDNGKPVEFGTRLLRIT
jgi:acetyl-CoA carboxylase biotin carboxyl carrier protein